MVTDIDWKVRAETAEAALAALRGQIEQAFRDGLTYATNCVGTDPDEAWRTSQARARSNPVEQEPGS